MPTACFRARCTNETLTITEVATLAANPGQAAARHGARPDRHRGLHAPRSRTIPMAAMSARSRSTATPARSRSLRYSVVDDVGTVLNPLLLHGQIVGGVAQGVGQILREDISFDPAVGPAR